MFEKDERILKEIISSTKFIMNDLNKAFDEKDNFSYSYSPEDKTQVYNASLLGARLLSQVFFYTKDQKLLVEAKKAIKYVCERQYENGSWIYGNKEYHSWIDSFHTGFNLETISDYQILFGEFLYKRRKPKYYNNKIYPIDIHSPSQLIVTLYKIDNKILESDLVKKVLDWTIENMQSSKGYFYYQKNRMYTIKTPYMRWTQAWMFYALTYYLRNEFERKYN